MIRNSSTVGQKQDKYSAQAQGSQGKQFRGSNHFDGTMPHTFDFPEMDGSLPCWDNIGPTLDHLASNVPNNPFHKESYAPATPHTNQGITSHVEENEQHISTVGPCSGHCLKACIKPGSSIENETMAEQLQVNLESPFASTETNPPVVGGTADGLLARNGLQFAAPQCKTKVGKGPSGACGLRRETEASTDNHTGCLIVQIVGRDSPSFEQQSSDQRSKMSLETSQSKQSKRAFVCNASKLHGACSESLEVSNQDSFDHVNDYACSSASSSNGVHMNTDALNFESSRGVKMRRPSKYHGVRYISESMACPEKWTSFMNISGERFLLGYHKTEEEAAHNYDEHAFSRGLPLNFDRGDSMTASVVKNTRQSYSRKGRMRLWDNCDKELVDGFSVKAQAPAVSGPKAGAQIVYIDGHFIEAFESREVLGAAECP